MKRKYMSNTYMKGVSDWELVIIKKEKEKQNVFVNMDKKELLEKFSRK